MPTDKRVTVYQVRGTKKRRKDGLIHSMAQIGDAGRKGGFQPNIQPNFPENCTRKHFNKQDGQATLEGKPPYPHTLGHPGSGVALAIGRSKGTQGMHAPLGIQILSISCSFLGKFWQNLMLAPPIRLVPPPRGNPGSAIALNHPWIRHCIGGSKGISMDVCKPFSLVSFIFLQFSAKILADNRTASPPLGLALFHSSGKSWIRHCFACCYIYQKQTIRSVESRLLPTVCGALSLTKTIALLPMIVKIKRGIPFVNIYRPKRSWGQGNIFTGICDSVNRGESASVHAGIPPPPDQAPP